MTKLWLLFIPLSAFGLCYYFSSAMHYESITAHQLKGELDNACSIDHTLYLDSKASCCNPSKDLLVINVTRDYVKQPRHITGAVPVRYADLVPTTQQWDKQKKIVIYCDELDPELALQAGRVLARHGFCNIKVYKGGLSDWLACKYPVCVQSFRPLALV